LGRWTVPDRSSRIADRPLPDDLSRLFIEALEKDHSVSRDRAWGDLVASIERLKEQSAECAGPKAECTGDELARGNSMVVLAKDSEGRFTAVKTVAVAGVEESIRREIQILKMMNHPLVVRISDDCCGANNPNPTVVTDFVENGSLADHLPDAERGDLCQLSGSTRIVRIIAGIVLAMRFVHSQNVIHRDLTPDNILLDCNWNVRICDFGHSVSLDHPQPPPPIRESTTEFWRAVSSRYLAPECYNDIIVQEGDVFSFGMILYELVIGRPVFPKHMSSYGVPMELLADGWQPDIPDSVIPAAANLIRDCLAVDYRMRPSFIRILRRLKKIQFKLMAGVNSEEIAAFVEKIEDS
jgi:serine/threonine protein kinase